MTVNTRNFAIVIPSARGWRQPGDGRRKESRGDWRQHCGKGTGGARL